MSNRGAKPASSWRASGMWLHSCFGVRLLSSPLSLCLQSWARLGSAAAMQLQTWLFSHSLPEAANSRSQGRTLCHTIYCPILLTHEVSLLVLSRASNKLTSLRLFIYNKLLNIQHEKTLGFQLWVHWWIFFEDFRERGVWYMEDVVLF